MTTTAELNAQLEAERAARKADAIRFLAERLFTQAGGSVTPSPIDGRTAFDAFWELNKGRIDVDAAGTAYVVDVDRKGRRTPRIDPATGKRQELPAFLSELRSDPVAGRLFGEEGHPAPDPATSELQAMSTAELFATQFPGPQRTDDDVPRPPEGLPQGELTTDELFVEAFRDPSRRG